MGACRTIDMQVLHTDSDPSPGFNSHFFAQFSEVGGSNIGTIHGFPFMYHITNFTRKEGSIRKHQGRWNVSGEESVRGGLHKWRKFRMETMILHY